MHELGGYVVDTTPVEVDAGVFTARALIVPLVAAHARCIVLTELAPEHPEPHAARARALELATAWIASHPL